jgi:hypothetical protein
MIYNLYGKSAAEFEKLFSQQKRPPRGVYTTPAATAIRSTLEHGIAMC